MMDNGLRMLRLLLDRKEEKFTIRKMSEILKMNYRTAHDAATDLEKEGLIRITKAGNYSICEFSGMFNHRIFEAEFMRRSELLKDKDMLVLHRRLEELPFPFVAILFGSRAKGTAGRHSDIDILAVGGEEKEIRAALSLMPGKIHLTAVSYGDFIRMARSREFTAVGEAMKGNVILIGIEEYYRMVKNAQ